MISALTLSYPAGTISDKKTAIAASERYDMEPDPVKDVFCDYGWTVSVVSNIDSYYDQDFPDDGNDYILSGLTDPVSRKIYVTDAYNFGAEALSHEMGHFIDFAVSPGITTGNASGTKKFKEIYEKEKDNSDLSDYEKSTPEEYFAECYKMYIEDRDTLSDRHPETYLFMDGIVKKIKTTDGGHRSVVYEIPELGLMFIKDN